MLYYLQKPNSRWIKNLTIQGKSSHLLKDNLLRHVYDFEIEVQSSKQSFVLSNKRTKSTADLKH